MQALSVVASPIEPLTEDHPKSIYRRGNFYFFYFCH